jgi:hypothetical protein
MAAYCLCSGVLEAPVGLHRFCKQCNGKVPVSINRMQVVCSSGHVMFDLEDEYLEMVAGDKQLLLISTSTWT